MPLAMVWKKRSSSVFSTAKMRSALWRSSG